jgi:hypothetical protein
MTGGFTDPDIPRNGRMVDLVAKMFPDFLDHLLREIGPAVKHGQHNAFNGQGRIGA